MGDIEFQGGKVKIDTNGNITLAEGVVAGNSSFRGSETISQGLTQIRVIKNWDTPPVSITVTPSYLTAVAVKDISESGFTISVEHSPGQNEKLNWVAIW